jgi:exopolysaccharide biosynthesis protein
MAENIEELKAEKKQLVAKLIGEIDTAKELAKFAGLNQRIIDTYIAQGNLTKLQAIVARALQKKTDDYLPKVLIHDAANRILRNVQAAESKEEGSAKKPTKTTNKEESAAE